MSLLVSLFLFASPVCAPERCEADCVAGSAKACVAAASALQASSPIKAAAYLQRACSGEEGVACSELATLFRTGRGLPVDLNQARQLDGRACALKVGTSCLELGRTEEKEAALARSAADTAAGMARSAAYLSAGCDAKVGAACAELARLHAAGCGVKVDATTAARLAKLGCELGDKAGCRYFAWFLEEGIGTKRDAKRAAELSKANADARALNAPPVCDDAPGLFSFESAVAGAQLSVDGFALGATPVVARLAVGEHVLVAHAPKRDAVRLVLTVTRGQRGRQVIDWPASLSVESTPGGASVAVDGQAMGLTPLSASLDGGVHELALSLTGYGPERRVVSVSSGESRTERFELRALPGQAQVTTEPAGALLEVDGKEVGAAPWSGVLTPGAHRVKATLDRFLLVEQAFVVARGEPTVLTLTLKPDPRFEPARVMVESTPPGASVSVDGAVVGVTPWEGEVTRGVHEVGLSSSGFIDEKRTVTATARQPYQLKVRLKPSARTEDQPVAFSVTSTPQGASVKLDGKTMGKTPWSGKVTQGEHEVVLSLAGYEPYTDLVSAPGQSAATLTPVLSGLRLSLPSTPPDLEVRIDEQVAVAVAGVFAAAPGRHVVELRAAGFVPTKSTVKVTLGQVSVVTLAMAVAPVVARQGLRVTSEPAGAMVTLNDAKVGVTPYEGLALEVGSYRVGLTLSGHQPVSTTLEVKKKQLTEHHVALVPSSVSLAIESTPSGARLFLDGEERGVTPLMLKVAPGSHRVYLVLEGYATVDEVRELQVAAAPKWSWTLTPNAAPPPPPPVAFEPFDAGVAAPPTASELETLRSLLADEAASSEVKSQKVGAYAKSHEDLTELVAVAVPARFKDELCATWAARVRSVRYQASAVDSFGNELKSELFVNGKKYATLPFDGTLPWCARVIDAREGSVVVNRKTDKSLDAKLLNEDVFAFPGRSRHVSFSALGEVTFAPLLSAESLSRASADLQQRNFGFGLRFDFWGQVFHFSLAFKESQLFRESIFNDLSLIFAPVGDLYLGLTVAVGSEQVRYRATLDVGAWSLLCPSVRLGNTLSIGERLFLTLTLDGAYVPNFLVTRLAAGTSADLMWTFGGTFAIGIGI